MRIGLIAMSGVRVKTEELAKLGVTLPGFVSRGKVVASLPSLGLLTVAALTPPHIEVCYREVPEFDPEAELEEFDLIGISSFSAMIDEAYALADRYRAAGTPVVLGGIHVTLMPDEAQKHADAIVLNGAEGAWPDLVRDFEAGRMRRRYYGMRKDVFEPGHYVRPRFDLLENRTYNRVTVQTSRGCPWNCEFCAASVRLTDGFQQKPAELAIDEIRHAVTAVDQPFLELADDNTFLNKRWGKEFLRRIAPLGVRWFTETDISVADDDELLDLLADSGCRQILIGLESPSAVDLGGVDPRRWKQQRAARYAEAIERIQSRGVSVNGCFILGLDGQTPDVFEQVRDFVEKSGLIEVQVTVQTAFPGTPLYARLKREGRLLQERYWDRCTLFDVNFEPTHMSVAELESGLRWLFEELYSEDAYHRRQRGYMELIKQSVAAN